VAISTYIHPVLMCLSHHAAVLMDVEQLPKDILSALPNDPIGSAHMSNPLDDRWTVDDSGFLRCDNRIYVVLLLKGLMNNACIMTTQLYGIRLLASP